VAQPLTDVKAQLDQLQRELDEIELLLQQTRSEAERHETRRKQLADRLAALERDASAQPEALGEARTQLLSFTQRAALMEGQTQVLEGKQKVLQRFQRYLTELSPQLGEGNGSPPAQGSAADPGGSQGPSSRDVLAAQEEMRREIARQMHDGPAQSIANIALQAQLVQRLLQHDPSKAHAETERLTQMVHHALEATKAFIFEVRPMVLDDLGLVATLRRASLERGRRSGVAVRFESVGQDRRLSEEMETGLFRILDDALAGFIAGRPAEIVVRLDWTDDDVRAQARSHPREPIGAVDQHIPQELAGRDEKDLPPALANVMREQREYEAAKAAERARASALPAESWTDIRSRASALGIEVALEEDGRLLEAVVSTHR
jgi:two-component system, NarL family, sensor histidine kinase DegS